MACAPAKGTILGIYWGISFGLYRDNGKEMQTTMLLWGICLGGIVPLQKIEYGFRCIILRSPYTPYSIYLGRTIILTHQQLALRTLLQP